MKYALMAGAALALMAGAAHADTLDPLHGYDWTQTAGVDTSTTATPGGGVTPLNGAADFGFAISPQGPTTGTQYLAIVLPGTLTDNNFSVSTVGPSPTSFSATLEGSAGAFMGTNATLEGYLSTFVPRLGTATPNNPIGSLTAVDTGTTSFTVYLANLGTKTLIGNACIGVTNTCVEDLTIGGTPLPLGAFIVSYLDTGASAVIGTANSGDLFVNQLAATPLPAALPMFLGGLGGLWGLLRRRRQSVAAA
ncbi:MAG TPA: hypothetical protein VGG61_04570 [Gemmataceae bacterium]